MKVKLVVSLVLAFFTFIFITQNTATVTVAFLAWSREMSLILLLFIMLGAGIILGCLLPGLIRFASQRKPAGPDGRVTLKAKTPPAATAGKPAGEKKESAP